MSMVRLIIKEIGGRIQNAAGAIDSGSNMFRGSSDNAPSDKVGKMVGGGSSNNSGVVSGGSDSNNGAIGNDADTVDANTSESDERLKTDIQPISVASQNVSYTPAGKSGAIGSMLKNLDFEKNKKDDSSSGGGQGMNASQFSGGGADAGGDAGDMGDMGDMASAAG